MLKPLFRTANDLAPLFLRVLLGAVFFPHGAQKVLGWFGGEGLGGTMDFFRQHLHIPILFACLAIAAELIGSLALIVGFFTRLAALGIATLMIVAVAMVHWQHGFFMNWFGAQRGEGIEYHLLAIGIALALAIKGGGKWALDTWLARQLKGEVSPEDPTSELQAARNSTRSPQIVRNNFGKSASYNDAHALWPAVGGLWSLPNSVARFAAIIDERRRPG